MSKGIFIISLDFELHWGGFDKWPVTTYESYFNNTRTVIPVVLDLFREFEVHATWASVGMLFHQSKKELLDNRPALMPTYDNVSLSAYDYIEVIGIGDNENEDPLHFAPSLVEHIIRTPNQELGSHTFAHYYCNEKGQTLEQFRDDLRAAQRAATIYGKNLKSLVFPRNQFSADYLAVCREEGFRVVRSNPRDWFWQINSTQDEPFIKRLARGMDAYLPIGSRNTYPLSSIRQVKGEPLCLPASRLLRAYRPSELFLNNMKIATIRREMQSAARRGEVYHLWWHPHNFGWFPKENLAGLRIILEHFAHCASRWNMQSMNMGEIADFVENEGR